METDKSDDIDVEVPERSLLSRIRESAVHFMSKTAEIISETISLLTFQSNDQHRSREPRREIIQNDIRETKAEEHIVVKVLDLRSRNAKARKIRMNGAAPDRQT